MTARFTVLASGSGGNASLLEFDGFGLLIDCGLQPRHLTARFRSVGTSWERVSAVVLTHTHTDHWKDATLAELRARRVPMYAHPQHYASMERASSFASFRAAGLAREYSDGRPLELAPGLRCLPVRVSHDSTPTYAFRIDGYDGERPEPAWAIGYASDLGCGSPELVAAFTGVDVLALEYNHDELMERASPRPKFLVDRVLSDLGHLSNKQAAELTATIAGRSGEGFPGHLVQLHLSKDCNTPELAAVAGREALVGLNPATEVVTARQDYAIVPITLARRPNAGNRASARVHRAVPKRRTVQPSLPGFDGDW
ncbi:MBL fold metallo-hydrolase [Gemmata sp. JC673]|uniref:MBL fold metallo-hydrolase n=1 Tax=Gemmata algarum TaxID=2975278 RepID=A0ABU5EVD5_9BACT|nr:MBL fold metallo-hydrolase [Gemmata algarum]MDY3558422.1 MBL fold metallo-hydrolase [Gemmata algarum]